MIRNFILEDFGGCDWCQINFAADRRHLLIDLLHHGVRPHQDEADSEDQDDDEDQETRVLSLHDAGFFQ